MIRPRLLCGVNVERCPAAKVVSVVLAREVGAARRGVQVEQGEAKRRGVGVQEALLSDVVGTAGQA